MEEAALPKLSATYACFAEANLHNAILVGSNLSNALMPGVTATLAEFSGCNLKEAVLTDADLSAAKLMGTNLKYADMSYAKLDAADFSQADLFFANLHGVSEEATKWSGASRVATRGTNKKRLQGEKLFKAPAPPPEAS